MGENMRLLRYGLSWLLLYLAIYLFANTVLSLTTYYTIPFWQPYFGFEKLTYVASVFAAAVLISAVAPIVALFVPLVLFYYAVQPFSEMLLLLLRESGFPSIFAMMLSSLAWFPANMEIFLAWGLGMLVGSTIGLYAFPGWHRIYGRLFRRFKEVV